MPVEEEPPIPASPADPALPLPLCGEVEVEEGEGGGGASARAGMARGKLGAGLATEAKLLLCCGLSCTSLSRRKEPPPPAPPPPDPWDAPPLLSLRPLMLMRCLFKLLAPPLPALEEPSCTTVKYTALHKPSRMDSLASAM